jgi:hypothetical protein
MDAKKIFKENPHTAMWPDIHKDDPTPPEGKLSRKLNLENSFYEYDTMKKLKKTTQHWGQRKLFESELEFLSMYYTPGDTIVYVGSAPGTHLLLLSELFPGLSFILYDPSPFDAKLYDNPKFTIFQKFFGDGDALRYKGKNYLFVSDIRTAELETDEESWIERKVASDMRHQERWYKLLQPKKALMKFRLPFLNPGNPVLAHDRTTFNYLDGDVYIQAFPRQLSAETRLVPNNKTKEWDLKLYEDAMFTHNIFFRINIYPYSEKVDGLDHCFDCASEVAIWKMFIEKTKSKESVSALSKKLNQNLSNGKFTPLTYISKGQKFEE